MHVGIECNMYIQRGSGCAKMRFLLESTRDELL